MGNWGATAVTVHGRTRQQRYSKLADWEYIYQCARAAPSNLQVLGNGDVFTYTDWNSHKSDCPELSTCMIARGALVKVCNELFLHSPHNLKSQHHARVLCIFVFCYFQQRLIVCISSPGYSLKSRNRGTGTLVLESGSIF